MGVLTEPLPIIYQQSRLAEELQLTRGWQVWVPSTKWAGREIKKTSGENQACQPDPGAGAKLWRVHLQCHHMTHATHPEDQAQPEKFMKGRSCLANIISLYDRLINWVYEEKAVKVSAWTFVKPPAMFPQHFPGETSCSWTSALFIWLKTGWMGPENGGWR